jgi:SAM-dependent methyltransferase
MAEAERKGLTNVRFEKRDAARLGETARFDFMTTFDAVHDQARPDRVLAGIAQALRPGGVYLCVDIAASSSCRRTWITHSGRSATPSPACTA